MPDPFTFPKPFCKEGDRLSAKNLNSMADAARVINQLPGSFINGLFVLQHPRGGGGAGDSSTVNVTAFAVVKETAGGSTHGPDGIVGGTIGKAALLDENMQLVEHETSSDVLEEDFYVEFKSLHRVPCVVDTVVMLHSIGGAITAGSVFESTGSDSAAGANPVWGKYIDCVDELIQLVGAGPRTALYIPADAETSGSDDTLAGAIRWGGNPCPAPTS